MLILYYYIYYICIISISVNFTVINNIFENPGDTKILHVVFRKWPKRQAYFHHGLLWVLEQKPSKKLPR